jgi:hypothetical protein
MRSRRCHRYREGSMTGDMIRRGCVRASDSVSPSPDDGRRVSYLARRSAGSSASRQVTTRSRSESASTITYESNAARWRGGAGARCIRYCGGAYRARSCGSGCRNTVDCGGRRMSGSRYGHGESPMTYRVGRSWRIGSSDRVSSCAHSAWIVSYLAGRGSCGCASR